MGTQSLLELVNSVNDIFLLDVLTPALRFLLLLTEVAPKIQPIIVSFLKLDKNRLLENSETQFLHKAIITPTPKEDDNNNNNNNNNNNLNEEDENQVEREAKKEEAKEIFKNLEIIPKNPNEELFSSKRNVYAETVRLLRPKQNKWMDNITYRATQFALLHEELYSPFKEAIDELLRPSTEPANVQNSNFVL